VKKIEKIAEVRNLNKEIRLLINKLKKAMPETGIRIPLKDTKSEKPKMKKTGNELRQLEDELRMIEHKIGLMSK
jgi:hypothetical protein